MEIFKVVSEQEAKPTSPWELVSESGFRFGAHALAVLPNGECRTVITKSCTYVSDRDYSVYCVNWAKQYLVNCVYATAYVLHYAEEFLSGKMTPPKDLAEECERMAAEHPVLLKVGKFRRLCRKAGVRL